MNKTKFNNIKTIIAVVLTLATLAGCQGRIGVDTEPTNAPDTTAQVTVTETPELTATPEATPESTAKPSAEPSFEPSTMPPYQYAPASEGIKNVFRTGIMIMPDNHNVEFSNRDSKVDYGKTQNDTDTTIVLPPTKTAGEVTLVFEGVILAACDVKSLFYHNGTDSRNSATFIENSSEVIVNGKKYHSVQFSIPIQIKIGISKVVIGTIVENNRNVLWNVEITREQKVTPTPEPTKPSTGPWPNLPADSEVVLPDGEKLADVLNSINSVDTNGNSFISSKIDNKTFRLVSSVYEIKEDNTIVNYFEKIKKAKELIDVENDILVKNLGTDKAVEIKIASDESVLVFEMYVVSYDTDINELAKTDMRYSIIQTLVLPKSFEGVTGLGYSFIDTAFSNEFIEKYTIGDYEIEVRKVKKFAYGKQIYNFIEGGGEKILPIFGLFGELYFGSGIGVVIGAEQAVMTDPTPTPMATHTIEPTETPKPSEVIVPSDGTTEMYHYFVFDGEVTITGPNTIGITNIEIPSTIDGMPVTSIEHNAFSFCINLTSITIPDSVTNIGNQAFYGCRSLTSITIPDSVTSIGNNAFRNCSNLTSITIPDNLTSIGDFAFSGCSSLTSITIPDGVTSIGRSAFSGCSSLTSITIREGIKNLEFCVFDGCGSLTSIKLPDSLTTIGALAFSGCSSLTDITIPYGVTRIGFAAFNHCSSLTGITFQGTEEEWIAIHKGPDWDYNIGDYTVVFSQTK